MSSRDSLARAFVETEGNEVSTGFHPDRKDKSTAVRCWHEAVDASGKDDKFIADACGVSKGYYSKVASGQQGDLIELSYRLPVAQASIRADFFDRLAATEDHDPLGHATEQMAVAAIRFLRAARAVHLPLRAARMAKAGR